MYYYNSFSPCGGVQVRYVRPLFHTAGIYPSGQIIVHNPPLRNEDKIVYPRLKTTVVIGPGSVIIGDVRVNDYTFIGVQNVLRADSSAPFYIGKNVNIHNHITMSSSPKQQLEMNNKTYGIYIEDGVSIHQHTALQGPIYIGRNTYIGQRVSLSGAHIGKDCVIMPGTIVMNNIRIDNGRFIKPGKVIWSQEEADRLPAVPEEVKQLNGTVVEYYNRLGNAYKENHPVYI
ncbi:hypothetical protein [Salirhabdus salicampi]|uniref:hypothetical protein n=1 Tax=Salirhabdus salicampi TaxID=476102 RepID=UPI0020C4C8E1|nr:hypothetical protein [Salirhabdus salicampi]MCP8617711.1 hypothetical protein [Salirhabdus salicampi]